MKILYVIDSADLYGSEMHLFDLASHFKDIYEIHVITLKNGPLLERFKKHDINYSVIKTDWKEIPKNIKILKNIIKEYNPDLIHAHQPKALLVFSWLGLRLKIPTIITIHSHPINNYLITKGFKKFIVLLFHCIISFFCQLCAARIFFLNKLMLKTTFFKKKSVVVYNWVSPRLSFQSQIINKRFSIKSKKIKFITIGSISFLKGQDRLIDFLGLIKEDFYFESAIIGGTNTDYIYQLKKKATNTGILERLRFIGYQNNISEYLKQADFFILLSRFETFGLVYIEAMHYGLPVIASGLSVLKEIIPDGNIVTDNLENARDMFKKLVHDKKLYQHVSQKNQEWSREKFDFSNQMKLINNEYRRLFI